MNAETVRRLLGRCRKIQDTLDQWIEIGRDLDELARDWVRVQEHPCRCRAGQPQGLRKRCIQHLETIVGVTGFGHREINKSLQYFALEQHAGWIQQLKSESKARLIKSLVRWHWEGSRITPEAANSLKWIYGALKSAVPGGDITQLTGNDIQAIVASVRKKRSKPRYLQRRSLEAIFEHIEGQDKQGPANRKSVIVWLALMLEENPITADLLKQAANNGDKE